jgi:hypothetical protein
MDKIFSKIIKSASEIIKTYRDMMAESPESGARRDGNC